MDYKKEKKYSHFVKLKSGKGAAVIFIDGLLDIGNNDLDIWSMELSSIYPKNPWYNFNWMSTKNGGSSQNKYISSKGIFHLFSTSLYAMKKADKIGEYLGEYILMSKRKSFILIGHSFGARIIYFTLKYLSKNHDQKKIKHVHLLGGAIDNKEWENCSKAVESYIYNYYTENDKTLTKLGKLFRSDPIGVYAIENDDEKIKNIDVSPYIDSHTNYKPNISKFITANSLRKDYNYVKWQEIIELLAFLKLISLNPFYALKSTFISFFKQI